MTLRLSKGLFFIGACALLLSASAHADSTAGINITVYNNYGYNNAPPLPSDNRIVGTMLGTRIENNFDQQPLFNMYEDFVVRYDGHISAPCTCPIRFTAQADDGTKLYINNVLITNDWYDKGGGGSISQPVQFTVGVSQPILLWFYENGGGAWVKLYWNYNGTWEIVPDSAFTTQSVLPTTTLQETTTTVPIQTTTTALPTTTTTEEPTTTTSVPLTTTSTEPPTTTTVLPTTTVSQTTVPPTTTTVLPTTTSTTTSTTTTTTVAPTVIPNQVTPEQAAVLATNPEVLSTATPEQAKEIFDALKIDDLSQDDLTALVAAVQQAPTSVRKTFEKSVNVFGGGVDTYVPVGSNVPVKTRRALIVMSLMSALIALPNKRK